MKAVVVYTWSRDDDDALVRADGSVDWRSARMTAGDDDPAALASALQITRSSGGQLVGLTMGNGDASWALARGVESTVSITDAPSLEDDAATAAILAAGIRQIGDVDVVLIGDSDQHPGVCVALAGLLGWPAMAGITSADARDGRVEAVRTVQDAEETISIATPVVIGIAAVGAESRTPGMKELLAARKRPVVTTTLADLGFDASPASAGSVEERGSRRPETTAARVFDGDAVAAVEQLVAALRGEGVLR